MTLSPIRCSPIAEGGDVERLEIPKEAKEEIKQSHGQVFEMSKEPAW